MPVSICYVLCEEEHQYFPIEKYSSSTWFLHASNDWSLSRSHIMTAITAATAVATQWLLEHKTLPTGEAYLAPTAPTPPLPHTNATRNRNQVKTEHIQQWKSVFSCCCCCCCLVVVFVGFPFGVFRKGADYLLMTWWPVEAWVLADYWRRLLLSVPPEVLAAAAPNPDQDGHRKCSGIGTVAWLWTRHRSRSRERHRCLCPPDRHPGPRDGNGRQRLPLTVWLAWHPCAVAGSWALLLQFWRDRVDPVRRSTFPFVGFSLLCATTRLHWGYRSGWLWIPEKREATPFGLLLRALSHFIFCFSLARGGCYATRNWPETSLYFIFFHESAVYSINQPAFVYNFTQTSCKVNKKGDTCNVVTSCLTLGAPTRNWDPRNVAAVSPSSKPPIPTRFAHAPPPKERNWDNWREHLRSREKESSVCGSPERLNALFWHLTHKCLVVFCCCCCCCCFSDLYVTPEVVT